MSMIRFDLHGHQISGTRSHNSSKSRYIATSARKPKPQKKKQRKAPISQRIYTDYPLDEGYDEQPDSSVVLIPGGRTPRAPAPADNPTEVAVRPEDLYPVFPKPQQSSVTSISDSKWTWGDDRPAGHAAGQDVPMWNPKTGFMKTRAQLEAEQTAAQQVAANTSSDSVDTSSRSNGRRVEDRATSKTSSSSHSSSPASLVEPLSPVNTSSAAQKSVQQQQQQPQHQQLAPLAGTSSSSTPDLPAVSRDQVLRSCLITSCGMAAAAAGLHVFAQQQAASIFGTDQAAIDRLLQVPLALPSVQEAGMMLAAVGAVTGARFVLLQYWAEFSEATERSNQQVLSPLGWPDVVLVAALTGVTEELLFRGGLIPATLPDYRGVLLSGIVFGLLHVTGGRNIAFAGWATGVGVLYGAAYLSTGNIWVAAGAHSLANFASAAIWIQNKRKQL